MFSGAEDLFCADFHQYDIRPDLADLIPWDDVFLIGSKQSAEPERPWNDDGTDTAFSFVKYQIADSSQTFTVAAIDHVLFL